MNVDHLHLERPGTAEHPPPRAEESAGARRLRPALFAGFADLAKLRHDYPLVLVEDPGGEAIIMPLSTVVDGILRQIAPPGIVGERIRQHVLNLEQEIRSAVAQGAEGTLSHLWSRAEAALVERCAEGGRGPLADSLDRARDARRVDGEVIDCDAKAAEKVVLHAWTSVHRAKTRALRRKIDGLVLKLSNILKSDFMKSDAARSSESLKSSVGTAFESAFDFAALSGALSKTSRVGVLPEGRRRRIAEARSVLESQRFSAPGRAAGDDAARVEPFGFVFDSCAAAQEAFRSRLPEMVEVVKAIAIAELEIDNRYRETRHDPLFDQLDAGALGPDDLALFPAYLVCLSARDGEAAQRAQVLDALASGLPLKILLTTDDILADSLAGAANDASGGGSRLAAMALGLNEAHVLQATSAGLYRMSGGILKGLGHDGPALFSVFTGAADDQPGLPPYLLAAAAGESRAFPAFSYDPAAGPDWASRMSLDGTPQPEADWPSHRLHYEDRAHQRITDDLAFTFADFALCHSGAADYGVAIDTSGWDDSMMPLGAYLDLSPEAASGRAPYVLMADDSDRLHRVIVGDSLIRAARRCRDRWRALQELGGIHNSHAKRALERERAVWEQEKERELAELRSRPASTAETTAAGEAAAPAATAAPPPTETPAAEEVAAADQPSSDEPYIETARCTTCNECTDINSKMFAYDDNMQAYIADVDAGPYRQLVEAAENCQVSIIHPGKPRNPDEPNLEEWLVRAEPFL